MGQDQGQVGTAAVGNAERTPEDIRRDIEKTRLELGDTAAALAAKTDVKARAKDKVEDVKQTIAGKKDSLTSSPSHGAGTSAGVAAHANTAATKARENPIPTAAIAAFVGGFLFGRITRRCD